MHTVNAEDDGGRGAEDEGREERATQRTDEVGEEDNEDEVDERTTQRTKREVGREAASITGVDDDESTGPVPAGLSLPSGRDNAGTS